MSLSYQDFVLLKSVQSHSLRNISSVHSLSCKKNLPLFLRKEASQVRSIEMAKVPILGLMGKSTYILKESEKKKFLHQVAHEEPAKIGNTTSDEEEKPQQPKQTHRNVKRRTPQKDADDKINDFLKGKLIDELDFDRLRQYKFDYDLKRIQSKVSSKNLEDLDINKVHNHKHKQQSLRRKLRDPQAVQMLNQNINNEDDFRNVCYVQDKYQLDILKELKLQLKIEQQKERRLQSFVSAQESQRMKDKDSLLSLGKQHRHLMKEEQILAQLDLLGKASSVINTARQNNKDKQILAASPKAKSNRFISENSSPRRSFFERASSIHKNIDQHEGFVTRRSSIVSQGSSAQGGPSNQNSFIISPKIVQDSQQKFSTRKYGSAIKMKYDEFLDECQKQQEDITSSRKRLESKIQHLGAQQSDAYNDLKFRQVQDQGALNKEFEQVIQVKKFRNKLVNLMLDQLSVQDKHIVAVNVKHQDKRSLIEDI